MDEIFMDWRAGHELLEIRELFQMLLNIDLNSNFRDVETWFSTRRMKLDRKSKYQGRHVIRTPICV